MCALSKVLYIFELKVDQDAAIAMDQVQRQGYSQQYQHQGKKIVIAGISFSSESRDVADWEGELLDEKGELIETLTSAS